MIVERSDVKTPLKGLKNLGPTIVERLHEIEVYTKEDLERVGPAAAYVHICARHPGKTIPVCYYLYSLEGALRGTHWNDVPAQVKRKLLAAVEKQSQPRVATRARRAGD
jgi:DNA transformation protein